MTHHFRIAQHLVAISAPEEQDLLSLMPSLKPFLCNDNAEDEERLLSLYIDINTEGKTITKPLPLGDYREVGDFDTGNGHTKVEKHDATGEYLLTIRNIREEAVCLLHTTADFRQCHCTIIGDKSFWTYGLNSALMLSYAFASADKETLLIHASCVKQGDYAYAFTAKSGTGKSTQVSNWLRHLPGCELLNDDNPIVRVIDGTAYIFGSPWSGKTPCYRNRRALLGAVTNIDRAKENSVERLAPVLAFSVFLPSCSTMKWETKLYNDVMDTITKLIRSVGFYTLHCLPDRESAEVCNRAIRQH